MDQGPATVSGNLTVEAGSTLVASYALDDQTHSGNSDLTVKGNLHVGSGAAALLGCGTETPCLDVREGRMGTVRIERNLTATAPLGVVLHYGVVLGSVTEKGGGGGEVCEEPGPGIFATISNPVYSAFEDSDIRVNLTVEGTPVVLAGARAAGSGGQRRLTSDKLADPDAIEILSTRSPTT